MSQTQATIPFHRTDRQFECIAATTLPKIEQILMSGRYLQGEESKQLEQELAVACCRKEAVVVSSGTAALLLGLQALDLPAGAAVAVPALSFPASATMIVAAGLRPVFVDVSPSSLMMDPEHLYIIAKREKIAAVMPVHLYGQVAAMPAISALARELNLLVLEDGAQAIGMLQTVSRDSAGLVTTISFDPMKVLGACGSGGAILTDDQTIANRLRRLRYHGRDESGKIAEIGFNLQLDELQACILRQKLVHMDTWNHERRLIAKAYLAACAANPLLTPLVGEDLEATNFHKFVIRTPKRDRLREFLQERGVETKIHYPRTLDQEPALKKYAGAELPVASKAVAEILSLPIYPEMTVAEREQIAQALRDFRA